MAWEQGPLPPGTTGWGAVILVGQKSGFFFAHFRGASAIIDPTGPGARSVAPGQIAWYDASIDPPPLGGEHRAAEAAGGGP
jgi:hypothetical protein